jgi:hypothetical protein
MILPFDRVVVTLNNSPMELSVEQFLQLPLDRRIGYVLSRAIQFFNGPVPVDRRVALASLQQQQAKAAGT